MHQFIGHLGPVPIRSYSLLFLLAYFIGIGVTLTLAKLQKKEALGNHLLEMAAPMFFCAIIGSRFWQVFLFEWPYYSKHVSEIPAVWHGGLSIQGGIVGAVAYSIWYVRKRRISFWELADVCAPGLLLGQSIGRDANLMNGDAFGDPTGGNFGLLYPEGTLARATFGDQPLWPAEVWEGQMDVILFAILLILLPKKNRTTGSLFLTGNVLYSIGRFLLELLRGDTPHYFLQLTTAQWTAVFSILLSSGIWMYLVYAKRHAKS